MGDSGGTPAGRLTLGRRERHLLSKRLLWLAALAAMGLLRTPNSVAQDTPDSAAYSNEPLVVEELSTDATFNETGTGSVRLRARILIGNESGVQQLGQMAFPYLSGLESLSLDFARVVRTDGSIQEVAEASIQDIPAPFSAQFPVYSDLRMIHFIAPSIRPGDILEYQHTREILNPQAPGRFFYEHHFQRQAIVRQEALTVQVPQSVPLSLRYNEELPPERTEREANIILSWTTSNPESQPLILEGEAKDLLPLPDVEISSFATWEEVGEWYRELATERASPTPEILEKAKELTEGKETDEEKVRAIYDFVAKDFRYLALLLGTTAYQPHHAHEVLKNGYGDCKDKHTLLEALLAAVGIQASPVVVSATRALSPEVPSPQQFDHLITKIDLASGEVLWLDSTMQVAPFEYLAPAVRGKTGLLIAAEGDARLVELPEELPFDTLIEVQVSGEIDDDANLTSQVVQTYRGDHEFMLRTMLFSLPTAQWPELAKGAHKYLANFGEVTEERFSGATETDKPLSITYALTQDEYIGADEEQQQLYPMLPEISLPQVPDDPDPAALEIDQPNRQMSHYFIQLSARFEATAPKALEIKEDFGEYRSSYEVDGNQLTAQRTLFLHVNEIEPPIFDRYEAFRQAIEKDHERTFTLDLSAEALADQVRSGDVEALYARAENAVDEEMWRTALPLLRQVVELDPDHPKAWHDLGRALANTGDFEAGIEAIRKQLEINPDHRYARNNLGWALGKIGDEEGAEAAYRAQLERLPDNRYATRNLGELLAEQDRCEEAVPILEKSLSLKSGDNWSRYRLGRCLLMVERTAEGVEHLEELVDATENTDLLVSAGSAAAKHEQYETAIALFEHAVILDPEDPDGYEFLGIALNKSGRHEEAIKVLQNYMDLAPDDSDMRGYIASLMSGQGDFSDAEEMLASGVETDSEALWIFIFSLHQSGKTEEAIEKARLHLEENPEDLEVLDALGAVQLSAKRSKEARETYQKIIRIDPDFPGAQRSLARGYFDAMRFDLAKPSIEKALEQDPSDWQALDMMAFLKVQAGDLEAGILHLEKALVNAPNPFDDQIREQLEFLKSQLDN